MGVRDKLKLQEYNRAVWMQGDDGEIRIVRSACLARLPHICTGGPSAGAATVRFLRRDIGLVNDGIRSHPHVSSFDCYGEISCDIIVREFTAYCPTERIRSRRVSSQPVGN